METIVNPVIGEKITFHQTARQTNGSRSLMEIHLSPKGGNPLHFHKRFAETFRIIEGELQVQVGTVTRTLKPNDTATAPKNVVHRFFNTSGNPVVFTCELTPGSEGFENVLRIGCGLANDGKAAKNGMPKSLLHMAILMKMGEGYFVGVFAVFQNIFRLLASTKSAKAREQQLLGKYCSQAIRTK